MITVNAGSGNNSVDLSGLQAADFPFTSMAGLISMGAGNDTVIGSGLADIIDAGEGIDVVDGGAGDDDINGGPGPDLLSGGADSDFVFGGDGDDVLWSGSGVPDGGAANLDGEGGQDTEDGVPDPDPGPDPDPDVIDPSEFDLDIDSDNDNGFNYPLNTPLEEELEDHPYALGKLLYTNDTHYTPMRLRLPAGVDTIGPDVHVNLSFLPSAESGIIKLWNTFKADPDRDPTSTSVVDGGSRYYAGEYSLADLQYNPAEGAVTLWIEAMQVYDGHRTYKLILDNGKPTDTVSASLIVNGASVALETVQYMVVARHSFYPNLQDREELRNAIAAGGVYNEGGASATPGPTDDPRFALRDIPWPELTGLGLGDEVSLVGAQPNGLKTLIFRDYVSGKYVLALAGTDFTSAIDWVNNIAQGIGRNSSQYSDAMDLAKAMAESEDMGESMVITGHSLGGGLASLASLVTGVHADTFNAAGLHIDTVPEEFKDAFTQGALDVDAYYLDWDILSLVQDYSPWLLPSAAGNRIQMDGPLDFEVTVASAALVLFPNPVAFAASGSVLHS